MMENHFPQSLKSSGRGYSIRAVLPGEVTCESPPLQGTALWASPLASLRYGLSVSSILGTSTR